MVTTRSALRDNAMIRGRTPSASAGARRSALSRMELIVALVLAICLFVTVPQFVLHNRQEVRRQQSTYRFRKIGLAIAQYYETYRSFPASPP